MPRQLRIEYPGANYHVMNHGTGKLWIYNKEKNLIDFLELLFEVKKKYKFEYHALILMRNHYHIQLETPFPNLSKGMNYLNGEFARRINKRNKRRGKVFRSRYKAILIDKEHYYKTVFCYINQNALRSKIVEKVEDYPGSIWFYLSQKEKKISKLFNRLISWNIVKDRLGKKDISSIKHWLNGELEDYPMQNQKFKYLLGGSSWLENIKKSYIHSSILPKNFIQKTKIEKASSIIWKKFKKLHEFKNHKQYKNIVIYLLSIYSNLNQSEIAEKLGISNSNAVGQRLYKFKNRLKTDENLRKTIYYIENG